MRQAPQVPQGEVRPPKASLVLPNVSVLHEDRPDPREPEIPRAHTRRHIEVHRDPPSGLVHQTVHEHRLARKRKGRGRLHRVELEVVDAQRAMQLEKQIRILPPVRRVVRRVGPKPQPELHALGTRLLYYRLEPIRKAHWIDVPESLDVPPRSPASLFPLGERRRIGRPALLPSVVDLYRVHAELRARLHLAHEELLVDARVAVSVAPGV